MENGEIKGTGSFNNLKNSNTEFASLVDAGLD
jgi:hypothetical protein